MDDDRVPGRTLLSGEDLCYGFFIECVCGQSIDGLGRHGHQSPAAQDCGSLIDAGLHLRAGEVFAVDLDETCMHTSIFLRRSCSRILSIKMAVETEIKFRVIDMAELEKKLLAAGFQLQTPRTFESNVLYDTPARTLRTRTEILRIRRYGNECTITHKRLPTSGAAEDKHKHRVETETRVDDADAMAAIFTSLGLLPAFRYEKWRTEWTDGEGHCVVDETPIGNYAELEGTGEWIDDAAKRLGVSESEYSTLSYGRLFEQWKLETGSFAEHLTFDNVQKTDK